MTISQTRGFLYRLARLLGWFQIFQDAATGHPDKATKKLWNKFIGRRYVRRVWWK